jgi:hypothetical protein
MKKRITIVTIMMLFSGFLNAQYEINDTFADPMECTYMTRDVFVVWWDNEWNASMI